MLPREVLQRGIAASMHAGAKVDQALRPVYECGEYVGCERIDGKHFGHAVLGFASLRVSIPDSRVVNHRVERAELVYLFGHAASLGDAPQIAHDHTFRPWRGGKRLFSSFLVASVQEHAVPLFEEKVSRQASEAVGGTRDEDARHDRSSECERQRADCSKPGRRLRSGPRHASEPPSENPILGRYQGTRIGNYSVSGSSEKYVSSISSTPKSARAFSTCGDKVGPPSKLLEKCPHHKNTLYRC